MGNARIGTGRRGGKIAQRLLANKWNIPHNSSEAQQRQREKFVKLTADHLIIRYLDLLIII
jgi:hypothetical protein